MKIIYYILLLITIGYSQLFSGFRTVERESLYLVWDYNDSTDWLDSSYWAQMDTDTTVHYAKWTWYDLFWREMQDSNSSTFDSLEDANAADSVYYIGRLPEDSLKELYTADTAKTLLEYSLLNGQFLHAALVAVRIDSDSAGYDTVQSYMSISPFYEKENQSQSSNGKIRSGEGNGSLR